MALTVGVAEQQAGDRPYHPFIRLGRVDGVEVDQEREHPDLRCPGHERQLASYLGEIGYPEHRDDYGWRQNPVFGSVVGRGGRHLLWKTV